MELTVKNLTLLSEGCAFESVPVRLNLPPCGDDPEPALIKLLGFPRCVKYEFEKLGSLIFVILNIRVFNFFGHCKMWVIVIFSFKNYETQFFRCQKLWYSSF